MESILYKLSTYHIINYLLPGIVFLQLLSYIYSINIQPSNIIVEFFIYYFCGMLLSRIGSITVEPIVKKYANFSKYSDYLNACEKDKKIDNLSEVNNLYRTLIVVFVLLLSAAPYLSIAQHFIVLKSPLIFLFIIMIVFIYSHIKQTKYIVKRVDTAKSNKK